MHGSMNVFDAPEPDATGPSLRERWPVLAVLLLSLVVTSVDHTIVNVALPEMVREVGASTSDLQWVVDAYTLVFAGLVLWAGAFGDRRGRKQALLGGLMAFGMGSVMAATASGPESVIAGRAVMGLGGAFIMPATLSILVNVFTGPRERAKAIAAWAAAAGLGIAVGPLLGGWLLRSFSWSSVFWINVPFLALAMVAGRHVLPESRAGAASRPDPVGALLSIAAVGTFVWAIIEAPAAGWLSGATVGALAAACGFGAVFAVWEARRPDPLLDVRLFRDRRFAAASAALTLAFLALAGAIFLVVQYLQFVLGYTPLAAGFALLPAAAALMVGTGMGEHLGAHVDARRAVTAGIAVAAAGVAVQAAFADGSSYAPTGVGLALLGLGLGVAMPAATASIMTAVPRTQAGVGSAVNDTARELGGAVGVAVIGSIFASTYSSSIRPTVDGVAGLSDAARAAAVANVGAALATAGSLGDAGARLAAAASSAFVDGMQAGLWVAATLAGVGAVVALAFLPGRARADEATHHAELASTGSRPGGGDAIAEALR
jgi:MFS transporter, DHA2 family, multidrug resistance protein